MKKLWEFIKNVFRERDKLSEELSYKEEQELIKKIYKKIKES